MIRSEARKGSTHVKVTFTIPVDGFGGPVAVVGDFNDWDPAADLLTKRGATLRTTVAVEAGRRYAFRYLATGGQWFNDEAADDYQPNQFGGSDSVVDLTATP